MKKYYTTFIILLTIGAILGMAVIGFTLYKNKENTEAVPSVGKITIMSDSRYEEILKLDKVRSFDEAKKKIDELEKNEHSMYNLAHLKQKKIQILLREGNYSEAVKALEAVLNNPLFPAGIKSRSMENVLTYYFASNNSDLFYKEIFKSPTFIDLEASSSKQSIYNYAAYGNNIYPTTIFGATVIYGKLENMDKTNQQEADDLKKFVEVFFANSDKEITALSAIENQETTLINIYTERGIVARKTSKIIGASSPNDFEAEFYKAMLEAEKLKDPFYIFYTTYNYIDYVANAGIEPRKEAILFTGDQSVFDKNNVPESWYRFTIKGASTWSSSRKQNLEKVNPSLVKLIEYYK